MQKNIAKKRLFDRAIEAINYYYLVQLFTPTKSVFFWLTQLNLLVGLSTNSEDTESKSLNDNYDKSDGNMSDGVGGKELVMKEELLLGKALIIEEKLEMEDEIEMGDVEGPE